MKFVSPSQLLECPLFGSNSGLFTGLGLLSHLLGAMGRAWGFQWYTHSLVPGIWSQDPSRYALSLMPQMCAQRWALYPVLWIWAGCPPHSGWSTGQPGGEATGPAAAGELPKLPLRVIYFLRKSCSILPLRTKKGLSSHTAHLSS